jgi:hypothetical protein
VTWTRGERSLSLEDGGVRFTTYTQSYELRDVWDRETLLWLQHCAIPAALAALPLEGERASAAPPSRDAPPSAEGLPSAPADPPSTEAPEFVEPGGRPSSYCCPEGATAWPGPCPWHGQSAEAQDAAAALPSLLDEAPADA